jgi:Fe-S cluster assembly iron-binding protein IscA
MAQEKSQNSFKDITQQEINLNFVIQLAEVKGRHIEYNKLNIRINEISFTYLNPENIDFIKTLQKIAKLYKITQEVSNEKVIEGNKEEILKLVALLLWKIS